MNVHTESASKNFYPYIKLRLEREIQTHTATLIKHRLGTYIAGVTYNITNIIYI